MTSRKIEEDLGKIENWHFIHNQKRVLAALKKILQEDEPVGDVIDGIYCDRDAPGKDVSCVLFATDRRLICIGNEDRDNSIEIIDHDDIRDISRGKTGSSTALTLALPRKTITFKTPASAARTDTFMSRIGAAPEIRIVPGEARRGTIESTIREIDQALSLFAAKNNETKSGDAMKEDMKDFLYLEAKKTGEIIHSVIDGIDDRALEKAMLHDIIILSSLAGVADGALGENEMYFISLLFIYLSPGASKKADRVRDEAFRGNTFPRHLTKELTEIWQELAAYMKEQDIKLTGDILASLQDVKKYDLANGTLHADSISAAYKNFAQCMMKADGTVDSKEEERLRQITDLITRSTTVPGETAPEEPEEETLEEVMAKIDKLVGMKNIKEEIQTFINLVKVQKAREERKLPTTPLSLHAVFYGPPGTGKTTIARILGKVYRALGLLEKGHLVETDRAGLVAGYVGQTATKTDEAVQKALDGILFIDEAYALSSRSGEKDFGQEAIDTILKRMEDYRERFAVIVAGYPDEMETFLESNPGLKSRFSRYFYFDHYSPEELIQIFDIFIKGGAYTVSEKGREKMLTLLKESHANKTKSFGNGRLVRNLFEKMVERQANRIVNIAPLTDEILCTLTDEDIPADLEGLEFRKG
jgi:SpoVK/Ycf46/Vps4 family AAA+-type ATPase